MSPRCPLAPLGPSSPLSPLPPSGPGDPGLPLGPCEARDAVLRSTDFVANKYQHPQGKPGWY